MGIAALVIGVLSFFICWIPFVGVAVSGLGLLLGLGGLVLAIVRRGSGIGFSIAGSGLSSLSLVICLVWTFALSSAFKTVDDSLRNSLAEQSRMNMNPVVDPDAAKPDQPQGPSWASPDKAVSQGDLQVQIARTAIGKVPLKDMIRKDATSKDDLLIVKLELLNTNPTKKVEYHSWAGADFTFHRDYATLKDNFGNSYKRISFGLGSHPVGAVERSESIYPNKMVTDVIVFEVPLDTAIHLDLELPATNYGSEGMVRFRISMKSVHGSTAAQEAAAAQEKAAQEKAAQEKAAQEKAAQEKAVLEKAKQKKALAEIERERLKTSEQQKEQERQQQEQNAKEVEQQKLAAEKQKLLDIESEKERKADLESRGLPYYPKPTTLIKGNNATYWYQRAKDNSRDLEIVKGAANKLSEFKEEGIPFLMELLLKEVTNLFGKDAVLSAIAPEYIHADDMGRLIPVIANQRYVTSTRITALRYLAKRKESVKHLDEIKKSVSDLSSPKSKNWEEVIGDREQF